MDPVVAETRRIRHMLRDLAALSALPAIWAGYDPRQLAESLVEVVLNAVKLDFVLLRLRDPPGALPLQVVRTAEKSPDDAVDRVVAALSAELECPVPKVQCIPDPLGHGTAWIATLPVGMASECGILIAGSRDADFPTDEERVLLNVGVNQAAMVLQCRRADEAMRQANSRLQLAVNGSDIGIWEINMPDGVLRDARVDFTNVWEQLGYARPSSPTDLPTPMSLIHPEDVSSLEAALDAFLAGATDKLEFEHRARRSDGSYRWMLSRGVGVRNSRGAFIRLIGSSVDITQQKQTREELKQAKDAAEEANRMKDEFLATLSHELRTPLSSILVWGQMLAKDQVCERDRAKALRSIVASAEAQNALIEDLLDVSRMISGKLRLNVREVELGPVARAVVDIVQPMANTRNVTIDLHTESAAPSLAVRGDPDRLQQIVWNLMTNAVKFTPRGGRVRLHLERADPVARIVVSDSGKGIAPQFLPYVFERFRQADAGSTRSHSGLGLGLAIIRELVQLHGGEVRAESAGLGRGATFTVDLPLVQQPRDAQPAAAPGEATDGNEDPRPLANLQLLVVEDEPMTREVLTWVLEAAGAGVTAVETVEEAMQALREQTVHVVISDIGMPGEDGYSLIQRIRRDSAERGKPPLPTIALTAYARPEDRERALDAGFEAFAPKPIKPPELIQTVARLGNRAR